MTERADQLHHDNAPPHATALMQVFLAKQHITQVCQPPLQPRFGSLWLLAFSKAKIAFEREEICECDGHTVHKLSQHHLTADWLAPQESDCSRMHNKVSSDNLPGYMKRMRPVLEILKKKMAGYSLGSPLWYHHLRGICLKLETANFSEMLVPVYQVTIHCCTGCHMSATLCGAVTCYDPVACWTVTFIIHKSDVSSQFFRAGGHILYKNMQS
jgi:hypothetical protein